VKEIEKRDSTLTSATQLDRLTRPGATYFNLNPYDVGWLWHELFLSPLTQGSLQLVTPIPAVTLPLAHLFGKLLLISAT